jgi:hypothetical protein
MNLNQFNNKYVHDKLELLCDFELILGLPCILPILEVVHSLIMFGVHTSLLWSNL